MRQVIMMMLVAGIFLLIMLCSNESLNVFNGKMETVVAPIDTQYSFSPYTFHLYADTVKWVFEFPPGGTSRASIILSGHDSTFSGRVMRGQTVVAPGSPVDIRQNYLDLAVETYIDSVHVVHLAFDTEGGFLDTVPIAAFQTSGVILHASSRLFVNMVQITPDPDTSLHSFDTMQYAFDTIPLADPHAVGGQQ